MNDFSLEYPDPEKIRAAVSATQALNEAQRVLMQTAAEAGRVLGQSDKQLSQTTKSVGNLRDTIQAAQIGSALEAVGRTAQLQAQVVGKSLQQQAGAIASHYQGLASGLERLMGASARRAQQDMERRRKASEGLIREREEEIVTLQALEAQASGTRRQNIQQEIALREAATAQEKQRIQSLEAEQRKAALQAARRQRDMAVFGSVVDTARAILQALANDTIPFTLRFATAAAAGATGALQLAAIRAQPLPQFRHGGPVDGLLKGPRHRQGGIPLEAEGGEWVFSREKTRQFRPLFEAIQAGKLKPVSHLSPNEGVARGGPPGDMAALATALSNLKQVHVHVDEKGFRIAEQAAHSRTIYLNNRYRS
ncbi:MAG: hypothetical protein KF690_11915 [Bacteroidetes bacterium]|nr:hypothetical protein [Bacteroidota bacterium]